MKEIKINVNMKVKNMYEFQMRHAYISFMGIASLAFSILAFLYLCLNFASMQTSQKVLLIIASLMFTVINPIWIFVNASKQVKLAPTFKDELIYELNENGIKVVQNDQELPIEWEDVQKIVETKNNIIIYLSRIRAFVIPQSDIKDKKDEVMELLKNSVDAKVCRLKKA